jgi:adenylate cyclase
LTVGTIAASRGTIQAVGFLAVWTIFLWVTAMWFFDARNVYVSQAAPQLALFLATTVAISYRQIYDSRDARRVTQIFGAYVGEEVLRQLAGRPPEMRGELRDVAVLFCDIRGFSTLAEQMQEDPALLLSLLNDHFDPLTEILKSRGAFVDKFVGDMVMGIFGAPLAAESAAASARNAVLSAIEVLTIVERRNRERRGLGEPLIEVGIGVHCGPAIVGNLGSRSRMNYTAIGDTVNIGSRVEDATRVYDIPLLVTEEVLQACETDPETKSLRWKFVDETIVRNRRQPVRLYTVRRESILERQVEIMEKKNAARVLR